MMCCLKDTPTFPHSQHFTLLHIDSRMQITRQWESTITEVKINVTYLFLKHGKVIIMARVNGYQAFIQYVCSFPFIRLQSYVKMINLYGTLHFTWESGIPTTAELEAWKTKKEMNITINVCRLHKRVLYGTTGCVENQGRCGYNK